jgi:hypothetical protein
MSEHLDDQPRSQNQRGDSAERWSTPIDIRIAGAFVIIVGAFVFFNGVVESLLHSAGRRGLPQYGSISRTKNPALYRQDWYARLLRTPAIRRGPFEISSEN